MDPETALHAFQIQHPEVNSVHRLENKPGWEGVSNDGKVIYETESDLRYFLQRLIKPLSE